MRYQGKITRWQDDKGFEFIAWHGGGSPVFVHIKAFSGIARRPQVGDIVTSVIVDCIPGVIIAVYGMLSVVTFVAYALDKSAAR